MLGLLLGLFEGLGDFEGLLDALLVGLGLADGLGDFEGLLEALLLGLGLFDGLELWVPVSNVADVTWGVPRPHGDPACLTG